MSLKSCEKLTKVLLRLSEFWMELRCWRQWSRWKLLRCLPIWFLRIGNSNGKDLRTLLAGFEWSIAKVSLWLGGYPESKKEACLTIKWISATYCTLRHSWMPWDNDRQEFSKLRLTSWNLCQALTTDVLAKKEQFKLKASGFKVVASTRTNLQTSRAKQTRSSPSQFARFPGFPKLAQTHTLQAQSTFPSTTPLTVRNSSARWRLQTKVNQPNASFPVWLSSSTAPTEQTQFL